jgi:hypothetical protein
MIIWPTCQPPKACLTARRQFCHLRQTARKFSKSYHKIITLAYYILAKKSAVSDTLLKNNKIIFKYNVLNNFLKERLML